MQKPNNSEIKKLTDDPQSYQIYGVFYVPGKVLCK